MIIRCPQCEHTRSINESKIPPTAELATCPKCKHRFRFRTPGDPGKTAFSGQERPAAQSSGERKRPLPQAPVPTPARNAAKTAPPPGAAAAKKDVAAGRAAPEAPAPTRKEPPFPTQCVQRPQSAFREVAEQNDADIWDAVDALHQRWQKQMDKNVTEVVTPRPDERSPGSHASAPLAPDGDAARHMPDAAHRYSESLSSAPDDARAREDATGPAGPGHDEAAGAASLPRGLAAYGKDGLDPERLVDEDMKMMRVDPREERPLRDLGTLQEIPEPARQDRPHTAGVLPFADTGEHDHGHAEQDSPESGVPWETPSAYGWFRAFLNTCYAVMFRGPAFFSGLGKAGPLAQGYLFFLIMGYITILAAIVWSRVADALSHGMPSPAGAQLSLAALLLVAPLALGLMLLFVTGCIRIQLKVLAPDKADFATAYRITAYSVAPFILSIVPFVGPFIGAAWFIFALVMGCRYALRLSWGLAVAIPLPPAVLLIACLCWYFL